MRPALQMAIESDRIRTDVVEVSEFPAVANRYSVRGVPKVIINETRSFEGAIPPSAFVQHVLEAAA